MAYTDLHARPQSLQDFHLVSKDTRSPSPFSPPNTIQSVIGTDSEAVHTDFRPADIDHSIADLSKAREFLGYESQILLHEGTKSLGAGGN